MCRKPLVFLSVMTCIFALFLGATTEDSKYIIFEADSNEQTIQLYYKDGSGKRFASLGSLANSLKQQETRLLFAMNAGMYMEDRQPLGLYVESGEQLRPLNERTNANGNFYLMPNGVFAIDGKGKMTITKTADFNQLTDIEYATQSGPLLLIDGEMHPAFNKGSSNLNIRNGVGILPNGNLLCVMSKEPVNFYDFASFFAAKGCKNALYLDGFVSKVYYPDEEWVQKGGNFGAIIGITAK